MSWDPEVEKRVHPFGEAGVRNSLEEVCKRAAEGAAEILSDPKRLTRVRTWSIEKIADAKKRGEPFHKPGDRARILLGAVQQKLWVPDPIGVEHIVKSRHTACDDHDANGICIKGGDCDDLCVLLAACFMSVGLYTMIVGHSYTREKNIGHVLCKVYFDRKWHYADPSPLGNGKYMDLGESAPPTRERYYSMPTIKVVCDGTTCDRQTLDPHELGFVEEGHFVGVNGVAVYELPPEAPCPRVEWLGEPAPVVQWLGEVEWLRGETEDTAVKGAVKDCAKAYASNLDTKTGREEAFKNTAKCSAEAACAIYSEGAIPPGVCGTIVAPFVQGAVQLWNSVFGDNEAAERAKIRDANTAKFFQTLDKLFIVDAAWAAYTQNTMTRLIQFHDGRLTSRRGAWGGGTLTKDKITHADIIKPGIPIEYQSWDVERYSNLCPVFEKLVKLGLPTKKPPAGNPGLCKGLAVSDLFYEFEQWRAKNPKAATVTSTSVAHDLITKVMPKWITDLDTAANMLRNEVVTEEVRLRFEPPSKSKTTGTGTKVAIGLGVVAAAAYVASELGWLAFLKRPA